MENKNLTLWNTWKAVPSDATKPIEGGTMNGKTDISPMWRIEKLTEAFGVVGFGWYYTIDRQWLEISPDTKEIAAFCNISLYVKYGDEWSKGIQGTGGNTFVAKNTNGLKYSDEAYKMALTDALSVACKALGIGADVYFGKTDKTKYTNNKAPASNSAPAQKPVKKPTQEQLDALAELGVDNLNGIAGWLHKTVDELTADDVQKAINAKRAEK